MAASSQSSDIAHRLKNTQSMIRNAISDVSEVDDRLQDSTQKIEQILGLHKLIDSESQRGKGVIQTLQSKAFWDKYLYKIVFIFYLLVVLFIVTKRFGNLFYKIYDWITWTLSFCLFWIPGWQQTDNQIDGKLDL